MDSEKKRSDEYWMGVRDALRMVDSFIKWARRNEGRAKPLDDFIHNGLVAAAKRCESCLKDELGLSFSDEEKSPDESLEVESVPSGYEARLSQDTSHVDEPSDDTFEVTPEDLSPDSSSVPIETGEEAISIDEVEHIEEEKIEDISIDGPPREFSTDFELIEPTELVVDGTQASDEVSSVPESKIEEDVSKDTVHKPSFTWDDYEKAVTPEKEDSEFGDEDEDIELPAPVDLEFTQEPSEKESIFEPPEVPIHDFERISISEEDTDETEAPPKITEPPPPPPPPESDEDEEERRRRARRLFFGD
ncbi:MAG: hypothetical protein AM325_009295 [Candidatus Thorarchaeota archaeon SMTZ1-45]|nr:MAG: hypothetical protein AM325_10795 [Candidatus Thorarchaeota archaeon SMTZ1-45]